MDGAFRLNYFSALLRSPAPLTVKFAIRRLQASEVHICILKVGNSGTIYRTFSGREVYSSTQVPTSLHGYLKAEAYHTRPLGCEKTTGTAGIIRRQWLQKIPGAYT